MDNMQLIADRATLRGYVATQIMCQATGAVLDVSRTVAAELKFHSGVTKLLIVTATHWDAVSSQQLEATRSHPAVASVNVLDGRDLFGRKKHGKALSRTP